MGEHTSAMLQLAAIQVTEAAARASYDWIGAGDGKAADKAAVDAMRHMLGTLRIDGTIVIGEGERDEAPMLYIGESVGTGFGPQIDIAVDPLEGTNLCATAAPDALSVMALAPKGQLLHAPDVYMEKIAVGGGLPDGIVSLDASVERNLKNLSDAKGKPISSLTVTLLERPRHEKLIAACRQAGARVRLIPDGDVAAVIATALPDSGTDMYLGIGGAPEGVLAAAALRCTGGQLQGRLVFSDDAQRDRAAEMGIEDPDYVYTAREMAGGDVIFAATGVTDGSLLRGVHSEPGGRVRTHSLVMCSATATIRTIKTSYDRPPLRLRTDSIHVMGH